MSYRDDEQEMLSYTKGGKTLWKQPYESVFAKWYAASGRRSWSPIGKNKEFLLGYGEHAQDDFFDADKKKASYQLADLSKAVAIDSKSGKVLWRRPGVATLCRTMSSQGSAAKEDTIVLCYYDAGKQTLTSMRDGYYRSKTVDAAWRVVGLDAKTGAKKWQRRLSDPYQHADQTEGAGMPVAQETMSFLPLEGGNKAVRNADGAVVPLEDVVGENVLCTVERDTYYVYSATLGTEAPWDHKASGDTVFQDAQSVCKRGSWKLTKAIPTVDEFRRAGYKAEKIVVLSQIEGMTAYRLTEEAGN